MGSEFFGGGPFISTHIFEKLVPGVPVLGGSIFVVTVQLPRAGRLPRFSIENASKRLDCPTVVYRGAVPTFCRSCHPTGRWLAALKAEKHGQIEKPLTGAVFESVARRTALPATNAVRV